MKVDAEAILFEDGHRWFGALDVGGGRAIARATAYGDKAHAPGAGYEC